MKNGALTTTRSSRALPFFVYPAYNQGLRIEFLLHGVLKPHIDIIGQLHKALIVRRLVTDAGDDVPLLERIACVQR